MHCNDTIILLHSCKQDLPMANEAELYFRRGTALVCVGRYAEAIEWFDRALERDPLCREVHVALAAAVDRLGLFREAVVSCDRALEIDNQFPDAWFIKGLALFRLSQVQGSMWLFPDTCWDGSYTRGGLVHAGKLPLPSGRDY